MHVKFLGLYWYIKVLKTMHHFPLNSKPCTTLCWSVKGNPNNKYIHICSRNSAKSGERKKKEKGCEYFHKVLRLMAIKRSNFWLCVSEGSVAAALEKLWEFDSKSACSHNILTKHSESKWSVSLINPSTLSAWQTQVSPWMRSDF